MPTPPRRTLIVVSLLAGTTGVTDAHATEPTAAPSWTGTADCDPNGADLCGWTAYRAITCALDGDAIGGEGDEGARAWFNTTSTYLLRVNGYDEFGDYFECEFQPVYEVLIVYGTDDNSGAMTEGDYIDLIGMAAFLGSYDYNLAVTVHGAENGDLIFGADNHNEDEYAWTEVFNGDEGGDEIHAGDNNDTDYDNDSDTVNGGLGKDWCDGGDGKDSVNGGAGDDLVQGGDGDDTCHGDDGDDLVVGEADVDAVFGDADDDCVRQGNGDNLVSDYDGGTCNGGSGNDYVTADSGDDNVLYGDGGADKLCSHAGADTLNGGPGDDELYAQSGDTLNCGVGTDVSKVSGTDCESTDSGMTCAAVSECLTPEEWVETNMPGATYTE